MLSALTSALGFGEPETVTVSKLLIHPIKSCGGTSVVSARCSPRGLWYDREFMVCDAQTFKAVTARELPKMVLIHPEVWPFPHSAGARELHVSFPPESGIERFRVPLRPVDHVLSTWELLPQVHLWDDTLDAYICQSLDEGRSPSDLLSAFLGRSVHLVYKGPSARPVKPTTTHPTLHSTAAFQDGYPLMILSAETLESVRERVHAAARGDDADAAVAGLDEKWAGEGSDWRLAERFRPNIVVDGAKAPFEEDSWEELLQETEYSDVTGKLLLVSRCSRCLLPNVIPCEVRQIRLCRSRSSLNIDGLILIRHTRLALVQGYETVDESDAAHCYEAILSITASLQALHICTGGGDSGYSISEILVAWHEQFSEWRKARLPFEPADSRHPGGTGNPQYFAFFFFAAWMADALTPEQEDSLVQLQSITHSTNSASDIQILRAVGWDVERAIQLVYDDAGARSSQPFASSSRTSASSGPSPPLDSRFERMEFDDSAQGSVGRSSRYRPVASNAYPNTWGVGLGLVNLFTFPLTFSFGLLSQLLQFVLRLLGLPIPHFLRTSSSSVRRLPPNDNPMVAADRLVRQLEEETGAVCVSRVGLAAHPASLDGLSNIDHVNGEPKAKMLPDFWIGSYKDALEQAKREARVLCVVLMSEEHEDMPEFRMNVLTDPDFVRVLTDNGIIVWAGDVRDREAYQVAQALQATTYPFIAFIALQVRGGRNTAATPSTTRLAVVSRHEGSPSSATSAPTLQAYITSTLMPRITPLLTRLRNEQRTREAERLLREDQDRAFREAEQRDRERVEKRRAEERARKQAEEEKRRVVAELLRQQQMRTEWRRWARKVLVPPESKGGLRIGVRLPDGRRLIRTFAPDHTLEQLYAFVDVQSLPSSLPDGDPDNAPANFTPQWDFLLAATYPRVEVPCSKDKLIRDVPALQNGANLVVEVIRNGSSSSAEEEDSDEE